MKNCKNSWNTAWPAGQRQANITTLNLQIPCKHSSFQYVSLWSGIRWGFCVSLYALSTTLITLSLYGWKGIPPNIRLCAFEELQTNVTHLGKRTWEMSESILAGNFRKLTSSLSSVSRHTQAPMCSYICMFTSTLLMLWNGNVLAIFQEMQSWGRKQHPFIYKNVKTKHMKKEKMTAKRRDQQNESLFSILQRDMFCFIRFVMDNSDGISLSSF